MRIIDRNKDFYDYIQYEHYDDTFTFERSKSYILQKSNIIRSLYCHDNGNGYLLMQICYTFWLFKLDIVYNDNKVPIDYTMSFLYSWTNCNKKREILKLSLIGFSWTKDESVYKYLIDTNDYREYHTYDHFYIWKDNIKEERNIPILKETGIASCVDAHDIYNALEMYFSEEKTASERTDPIGATNNDKIVAHGFDTKTSFRK